MDTPISISDPMMVPAHLLDTAVFAPEIFIDLRYATKENIFKEKLYPYPRCYLHREALFALKKVAAELYPLGYCLKIFDGYRPLHVQKRCFELFPLEGYVANPEKNKGRHTRGTAIDLTLTDLNGDEVEMPSAFDTLDATSHADYEGSTPLAAFHYALLRKAMERHGFIAHPNEWWHFDLSGWQDDARYPPLDLCFDELDQMSNLLISE